MGPTIRYVLLTATRDRLFFALIAAVLVIIGIAYVMGQTALVEPHEMTLSLSAAGSRLVLMVGLIVFVCFHLRAAFHTKEIDVLLSRPITRPAIVIAYWLGFACVATLLAGATVLLHYMLGVLSSAGFWFWALSLLLESWLVVAIALFAGFALRSAVSAVLASMGFYALSRMMGFFIATAQNTMATGDSELVPVFQRIVDGVAILIPRLDFFAQTRWLVYGLDTWFEWAWFTTQAAIFIPLLIMAAIIDFKRRQF